MQSFAIRLVIFLLTVCYIRCQSYYYFVSPTTYFVTDALGNRYYYSTTNNTSNFVPSSDFSRNQPQTRSVKVSNVFSQFSKNGKRHNTHMYFAMRSSDKLVVRRGEPFSLDIVFSRPINLREDEIYLSFNLKPFVNYNPAVTRTMEIQENIYRIASGWQTLLDGFDDNTAKIEVNTPVDCEVGAWYVTIITGIRGANDTKRTFEIYKPIYILFNPWLPDDTVFFGNNEWRKESLLETVGKLWKGVSAADHYRFGIQHPFIIWNYGQINANDENGMIEGKWKGSFADGVHPDRWTGSPSIILQYFRTGIPVKYGQCWVFAGVAATVLRAVGIPNRVITAYSAPHDTDGSLTVDFYYNSYLIKDEYLSRDSIWIYHAWNEAWMRRPDLGDKYNGWQVIDSTPQEPSRRGGRFTVGPTSLIAIKNGDVNLNYDVRFVFAEVNSDVIYWYRPYLNAQPKIIKHQKDLSGKSLSTKKPGPIDYRGNSDRIDITSNYKYPEGTNKERSVYLKAMTLAESHAKAAVLDQTDDNKNEVVAAIYQTGPMIFGRDYTFYFTITNRAIVSRTVDISLTVQSKLYTGENNAVIKAQKYYSIIYPGQKKTFWNNAKYSEYSKKLQAGQVLLLTVVTRVNKTQEYFSTEAMIPVRSYFNNYYYF